MMEQDDEARKSYANLACWKASSPQHSVFGTCNRIGIVPIPISLTI